MPGNGHESDGNAGVKKRQFMNNKPNSFGQPLQQGGGVGGGSNHGYSTDESSITSHDVIARSKDKDYKRQPRRGKKTNYQHNGDATADSSSKASVIWMVLVVGLMFCLLDAMYIIQVVDRGDPHSKESNEKQNEITARILDQLKREQAADRLKSPDVFKTGDMHDTSSEAARIYEQLKKEQQQQQQQHQHQGISNTERNKKLAQQLFNREGRGRDGLTKEERKAIREAEAKLAEENRIKMIKMAALEALKAQNGGKIPDDMLEGKMEDDEAFKPRPMSYYREQSIRDDKRHIIEMFEDAGLKEMDDSTYAVLPTWEDVSSVYGSEPRVIGLEQCKEFRAKGNPWDHFVSTAGTFNSGTNLMAEMLIHNCHMQDRMDKLGAKNRGIRWQGT